MSRAKIDRFSVCVAPCLAANPVVSRGRTRHLAHSHSQITSTAPLVLHLWGLTRIPDPLSNTYLLSIFGVVTHLCVQQCD